MKFVLYDKGKLDNILYFQIQIKIRRENRYNYLITYHIFFFFRVSISFNLYNTNKYCLVLCLKLHLCLIYIDL